jgi:predicted ATPase
VGDTYAQRMAFEAEMIIPSEGIDDLGQTAEASITFLHYIIELAYHDDQQTRSLGSLEIIKESLEYISVSNASKHLLFNHDKAWRKKVIKGKRTSAFISDGLNADGNRIIKLHKDGNKGNVLSRLAANLPRTVLSVANAAESPTVLLARREMQSWRLLQLEPSSLRQPDEFSAPNKLGSNGSHLPATLYHLARSENGQEEKIYTQVANRLAELVDDVDSVFIDRDDRRELLTLMLKSRDGTLHSARALSDGTMRFLALIVLELDPSFQGLLCLEEPENGIHPERIPKILRLLQDLSTDVIETDEDSNPLRQVIINTHSPAVVQQVPDDSLLVAELKESIDEQGRIFKKVCFSSLPNTWRDKIQSDNNIVSKNKILAYLNPVPSSVAEKTTDNLDDDQNIKKYTAKSPKTKRVIDRPDIQPLIPGLLESLS